MHFKPVVCLKLIFFILQEMKKKAQGNVTYFVQIKTRLITLYLYIYHIYLISIQKKDIKRYTRGGVTKLKIIFKK